MKNLTDYFITSPLQITPQPSLLTRIKKNKSFAWLVLSAVAGLTYLLISKIFPLPRTTLDLSSSDSDKLEKPSESAGLRQATKKFLDPGSGPDHHQNLIVC